MPATTFLDEYLAMESALSGWDEDADATIAWDNSAFDPAGRANPLFPWIRPRVVPVDPTGPGGLTGAIECGPNARTRYHGLVIVDVFTEAGTGVALNMTLAQSLAARLRRQTIGGVQFGDPYYRRYGTSTDEGSTDAIGQADGDYGNWFLGKVIVPYRRESTT